MTHYQPNAPTNHFEGRCDECDAHYMARLTLGQVEDRYHQGRIKQHQYEAYRWVWATNPSHAGYSHSANWTDEPFDDARIFGELLRSALANDRTLNFPGFPSVRAIGPDIVEQR